MSPVSVPLASIAVTAAADVRTLTVPEPSERLALPIRVRHRSQPLLSSQLVSCWQDNFCKSRFSFAGPVLSGNQSGQTEQQLTS